MLLTVVRVYQQGRKLSEAELRAAVGVVGDVRTQIVHINGKAIRQAVCMGGSKESFPPLIEPQLTGDATPGSERLRENPKAQPLRTTKTG